jgi:hypothetical protein
LVLVQTWAGNTCARCHWRYYVIGRMGYSPSLFNRDDSKVSTQRNPNFYFVDPRLDMIEGERKQVPIDWIVHWSLAHQYSLGNQNAIEPIAAAVLANDLG